MKFSIHTVVIALMGTIIVWQAWALSDLKQRVAEFEASTEALNETAETVSDLIGEEAAEALWEDMKSGGGGWR